MADSRGIGSITSNDVRGATAREIRNALEREQRIQKRIFSRFDIPEQSLRNAGRDSVSPPREPNRQAPQVTPAGATLSAIDSPNALGSPENVQAEAKIEGSPARPEGAPSRRLGQIIDVFA